MNLKKKVSVIIPVYNRSWCISNCIDSVLSQSYQNFELIIVDDGSDDKTCEIIDSYAEKFENIRVVHQLNKGVSAARNAGINICEGEYIAFLDSDDLWTKNKLEVQMNFFSENKDAYVCQTEEIWIRNGKRVNPKKRHKKPQGDIFIPSLSLCLVSPSAVMMKRSFFTKAGYFDESMRACEDYDLWLRASLLFDFYVLDNPCVIKNGGHPDQLSSIPLLDKYRIYSLDKLLKNKIDDSIKEKACIEKLIEKCRISMNGCKKRSRWEEYFIYRTISDYWGRKL